VLGVALTQCPRAFIGDDMAAVRQIVRAADFARKGKWPCAGGWGDQAEACVAGVEAAWAANEQIELLRQQKK
jgi:hypothetical protein